MSAKTRIPITAITVFGTSMLIAISIGIVLYLGFNQAAETTRELWAEQAETLINSMEQSLDAHLKPVRSQARWIARDIKDIENPGALDDYVFGSMAATPQVAGVAIISTSGETRRWYRKERRAVTEDWSQKPWFKDYMAEVRKASSPVWRDPVFSDTFSSTTLLHDVPLTNAQGEFIGIFAQVVTLQDLSIFLAGNYADTGITPFVLHNRDYVLAHPIMELGSEEKPLPSLEELGDLVLQRIWSPDEEALFISSALQNTKASGLFWGNDYYLFLYREITHFGPSPWTMGAYLNTTLLPGGHTDRMLKALAAGLIVLLLAIIAAIIVGRKVSSPIQGMVKAANTVDEGKLDAVDRLTDSYIREIDDANRAFNNMVHGLREREIIRDTLGRFVPEKVASSLLAGGGSIPVTQTEATVLFCDIEGFTRLTESLGPVKIVDVLNAFFSAMVEILEQHGGVVTQFQGDAILATFNVPLADASHAGNAIEAAQHMLDCVDNNVFDGEQLNIRIGINTGTVVAGAIGAKGRLNYTVHGDAVNLAARLEALNKEYGSRLLISESSANQAPELEFSRIGEVTVRGQTTATKLFTVKSIDSTHPA